MKSYTSDSEMLSEKQNQNKNVLKKIPVDILNNICTQFLLNVSEKEKTDPVRFMFNVESAHWYYMDNILSKNKSYYPETNFKNFVKLIMESYPSLCQFGMTFNQMIGMFNTYKKNIPVYGGILINRKKNRILIQQPFYSTMWGFPAGKVNENETSIQCASREIYEETGIDVSNKITSDFLIKLHNKKDSGLYVIFDIDDTMVLNPKTKGEIRKIMWVKLSTIKLAALNLSNKSVSLTKKKSSFNLSLITPYITEIEESIKKYNEKFSNSNDKRLLLNLDSKSANLKVNSFFDDEFNRPNSVLLKAASLNKNFKDAIPKPESLGNQAENNSSDSSGSLSDFHYSCPTWTNFKFSFSRYR